MKSRFRQKLTWTLILFATLISVTIATTDHLRMRQQAITNTLQQIQLNEKMVKHALETIDKAYFLFGENIAADMKNVTERLMQNYEANPRVEEWDLSTLKKQLNYDIYLIDSGNRIVISSFEQDIGLDFDSCCQKLAKVLDERRTAGGFYHDWIDVEQQTGKIKKYSYESTKDKKYILQLGYSLEDQAIFREFNFFNTIEELIRNNPSIDRIRVLNIGGRPLDESADNIELTGERKQAFEETLATGRTTEFRDNEGIFRYVQYESEYDSGSTGLKVLEIEYNNRELKRILSDNKRMFLAQAAAILTIAIVLSVIISRWVARPMYLAFHDSLTGLKNRASFDESLLSALHFDKDGLALLMIDLDNFKAVNDRLGHDKGDLLLKKMAYGIQSAVGNNDAAFRLGGDEFVVMISSATPRQAETIALCIMENVRTAIADEIESFHEEITVSIGIALAPEHGTDPETLCKNADTALYRSKELGKNQFCFHESIRT